MTGITNVDTRGATAAPATRTLLAAGVLAGPLFIGTVLLQELLRTGFDPQRHALSQLSLGDLGWLQIANFIVTGLLFIAAAVGIRRRLRGGRAGTWGPWLIGGFGAALVWSGGFVADPAYGYPPGTPDSAPEQVSWHGALHTLGPIVAGIAVVAACFVFARRFAATGQRGWVAYSVGAGATFLVLGMASFPTEDFRLMLAGGIVAWSWASVLSAKLLAEA